MFQSRVVSIKSYTLVELQPRPLALGPRLQPQKHHNHKSRWHFSLITRLCFDSSPGGLSPLTPDSSWSLQKWNIFKVMETHVFLSLGRPNGQVGCAMLVISGSKFRRAVQSSAGSITTRPLRKLAWAENIKDRSAHRPQHLFSNSHHHHHHHHHYHRPTPQSSIPFSFTSTQLHI